MATAGRKRRPQRRDEILAAAVTLFHERGYEATGIDDIGEAASITGPAVYRHFSSKREILDTLLRDRGESALAEAQAIAGSARSATEALDGLIDQYARAIVDNPSLTVVTLYERRTLDAEIRSLIDRLERLYIEEWVHAVAQNRPDLSDTEVRITVHAVLGMGVAIANYDSGLPKERLANVVGAMISAGLGRAAP
jgi:AcrR family transcriptional regulator